ncbi:ATP-binding cassette sub- G member 1 [Irineochytrium annulatum]|nr:ATP-binding cassette sub- G member 1 [Irineochytrium annulatum]
MPLMLFAGVFVQSASIPKWIGWLQYLSPIKYGFEALAKNEFTGLMFPMAVNTVTNAPLAYFQGETEISALGLADDNLTVGVCIIILTCMTVALIMGAYGMLVNLTVSRSRLKRAGQAGSSGKGGDARKGDMRKVAPMNEKM